MSGIDCEEVLRRVERYLDGELERMEAVALEVHVRGCSPCLDRVEFRTALREIVRRKCSTAEVPGDLTQRIRRTLRGG